MVLQDDRNSGSQGGERAQLARKVESVHVKDVRFEGAEQPRQSYILPDSRRCAAERQEMVADAAALQTLAVRDRLPDRNTQASATGRLGDIDQRGPGIEKLPRRAARRIVVEADLHGVQRSWRRQAHRLITRGSPCRMSFLERSSSHGRS